MIATCNSFIHEYDIFDDLFDSLNEATRDIDVAVARYNMKIHQLNSKLLFEAADADKVNQTKDNESKGVLTKIGETVLKLIEKVSDFIQRFTNKITGNIRLTKADSEKVTQIMARHPELKDQIVEGINKEWFTVSDVAKFEKDTIGLIQMLQKNAIDHQTFMDKFRNACQAFTDSAKPFTDAAMTGITFFKIIPEIHKAAKGTNEALSGFRSTLSKIKDDFRHNYGENHVNAFRAITNALSQAIGLTTEDAKKKNTSMNFAQKWLHKICHTDERQAKAADKIAEGNLKVIRDSKDKQALTKKRRVAVADKDPSLDAKDLNRNKKLGNYHHIDPDDPSRTPTTP